MAENGIEYEAHEAFQEAGQQPGIEIWRIESFEPVPWDPKKYGQFHNGDAYIVMKTQGTAPNRLSWNIHFWLGKNCAQDEAGSAAFRTVELDDHLNGAPVQYREVQGHESKLFLSYFKKGIKYLEGGIASGFNKVEEGQYEKRLFHCKGKHTIRVEQVEVKCGSLNQGDVFILDDGPNMYVWVGPNSSRTERIKGLEMARTIRDEEKAGRSHIHIIEDDWDTNADFFKALGSKDKAIKSGADLDDDETVRKLEQDIILYRISEDENGKISYKEVSLRPFQRSMLESENCYVLDSGYSGIYCWTGKECSNDFKRKVWAGVNHFIEDRGYPAWMSITRVIDGGETPLFKQYFSDWEEMVVPSPEGQEGESNVAEQSYEGFDGAEMHNKNLTPKAEDFLPDDGAGKLQVWMIKDLELSPVPEFAYGVFFGGDSYVIQYDYEVDGKEQHIIYFWQGLKSTTEERGASALHAMKLDDDLGGQAVQIRVVMNKEPAHFLKIFKGRLIVFMDGHVDGYQGVRNHDYYNPSEPVMFHIRGDDEEHTRALQVECRANSLNTNDIFLIDTTSKVYAWVGKQAQDSEKEMARHMAQYVAPDRGDPVVVLEGEENLNFWNNIGGQEPYYTGPKKKNRDPIPSRLFHCSNASGKFKVEEVHDFDQTDLDEDDVMILDTYEEIFIWVGQGANEFEKKEAYKTSYSYLNSDPSGRNEDNTLMVVVREGFEPPQFTGQFQAWDAELWSNGMTFKELMEEVGKENAGINLLEDEAAKYTATYSYDVLKRRIPPEGVDVTRKEQYLSEEDFEVVFEMSKMSFNSLPEWKRVMLRKEKGLF